MRIFNAYGPGQSLPPAHAPVVPLYLKSILSGASLVVYGDGDQTRDFIYIEDVVEALVSAAQAPGINRTVINVGSGQETSINGLIGAIGDVTGRRPDVIYNPQQSGGIPRLVADVRQARDLLGYVPRYSLGLGLQLLCWHLDPRFSSRPSGQRTGRGG